MNKHDHHHNPLLSLDTARRLVRGAIPGQLVIQIHSKCNAHCPQCGMRVTSNAPRSQLASDDIKRLLDAAAARGVEAVSFTGGEPLLFVDELLSYITYAQQAGIRYIRTGTNGYMFRNSDKPGFAKRVHRLAETLAQTTLYTFWISIDSAVPAVHEQMRGLPGVVAGIEQALPIFHSYGIYPAVNLGVNRNVNGEASAQQECRNPQQFYQTYREAFRTYYQFAYDLGFTMVNACYPMSIDEEELGSLNAVYTATSPDHIVRFTAQERALVFKALLDTIPEYRARLRIFTPQSSLYALFRQYTGSETFAFPCRGGIDFFFVDSADGQTYPCGYRGGESLGHFWEEGFQPLDPTAPCRACDWECFRDPSELLGPAMFALSRPAEVLRKFKHDKIYAQMWLDDVRYYQACHYFNGRHAPDYARLARWARQGAAG